MALVMAGLSFSLTRPRRNTATSTSPRKSCAKVKRGIQFGRAATAAAAKDRIERAIANAVAEILDDLVEDRDAKAGESAEKPERAAPHKALVIGFPARDRADRLAGHGDDGRVLLTASTAVMVSPALPPGGMYP